MYRSEKPNFIYSCTITVQARVQAGFYFQFYPLDDVVAALVQQTVNIHLIFASIFEKYSLPRVLLKPRKYCS